MQFGFGADIKVDNLQSLINIDDDALQTIMDTAAKKRRKRPRSTATTPVKPRRLKKGPLIQCKYPIILAYLVRDVYWYKGLFNITQHASYSPR